MLLGGPWDENGRRRKEQREEKEECWEGVSGAWYVHLARCAFGSSGGRSGGACRGVSELSLASVSRENPDRGARGALTGDYLVGQVAESLFHGDHPSGGSAARLASLFSSFEPQLQPVYVPVPKVSYCGLFRMAH